MTYHLRRDRKDEDILTPEERHIARAMKKAGFQSYDPEVEGVTPQDFTTTDVLYHHYRVYWANLSRWALMEMLEDGGNTRPLSKRQFGVAIHRVFPHLGEGKSGEYRARHRVNGKLVWGYRGIKGPDSNTVADQKPPSKWKAPKFDGRKMRWKTDPVLRQLLQAVADKHEPDGPQEDKEQTAYDKYLELVHDPDDQDRRADEKLPELRPITQLALMKHFRPYAGLPKLDRRKLRAQGTPEQREEVRNAYKRGARGNEFLDIAKRVAGLSPARAYALIEDLPKDRPDAPEDANPSTESSH